MNSYSLTQNVGFGPYNIVLERVLFVVGLSEGYSPRGTVPSQVVKLGHVHHVRARLKPNKQTSSMSQINILPHIETLGAFMA